MRENENAVFVSGKLVLPGEHLASAMEYEAGENTYIDEDEIYSAAAGTPAQDDKALAVKTGRMVLKPAVGDEVYCIVRRTSNTKAFVDCITAESIDGNTYSASTQAVLPVTEIRRGHVRDIRDEVKTGDILRAKISAIEKEMVDVSIFSAQHGVVVAFCSKCRARMHLKDSIFTCSKCYWRERRKIPGPAETGSGDYQYRDQPGGRRPYSNTYGRYYHGSDRRNTGFRRSDRYGNRSFDERKKHY